MKDIRVIFSVEFSFQCGKIENRITRGGAPDPFEQHTLPPSVTKQLQKISTSARLQTAEVDEIR